MPSPRPLKLIAVDLDGTLLTPELTVHPRTAQAVRAAADRGVTVAIATGRTHAGAEPFAFQLGLNAPIISYNGAMIRNAGAPEPLRHQPIDAPVAAEAVDLCVRLDMDMMYFLDDSIFVPRYDHWAYEYLARTGNDCIVLRDLRSLAGRTPTKLLVLGSPEQTRARYDLFTRHFAGRLHVTISLPEYLELLHPAVSKAAAVARLAAMLDLGMDQVMAVGDSLNDLEMVQQAGVGVMMPTAAEELRAAADYVPQSLEAGVAEAIEHFVLASSAPA